jgi:hypothetical protein
MTKETQQKLYGTLCTVSGYFGHIEYVKQLKRNKGKRLKQFTPCQEQLEILDMLKTLSQNEVSQEDEERIKGYIMTLRMSRGILNKIYLDIEELISQVLTKYDNAIGDRIRDINYENEIRSFYQSKAQEVAQEIMYKRHYNKEFILKVYESYIK